MSVSLRESYNLKWPEPFRDKSNTMIAPAAASAQIREPSESRLTKPKIH